MKKKKSTGGIVFSTDPGFKIEPEQRIKTEDIGVLTGKNEIMLERLEKYLENL